MRQQPQTSVSRVQLGLFIAIFLCLISVYLASYSGRIESSDSLRVVDTASSLVNFGDFLRDESLWQEPPRYFLLDEAYPFSPYNIKEPLITIAAAIPYAIATYIPQVGQVHATWLLNILVVALSGSFVYVLAIQLNFGTRTAVLSALLFGLGTIVWAYSKTLFRDPLIILWFLIIATSLEQWRVQRRYVGWLLIAIIAMIAAYYTKNSSVFALPALLIWIIPSFNFRPQIYKILDVVLLANVLILILIAFNQSAFDLFAQIVSFIKLFDTVIARQALHSYLFSIGGSIWGTSPILLLGLIGGMLFIKHGQRRVLWSALTLIASYAVGHAILADIHWFGGLSLPPRFMLPTIPFALLLAIPVIDYVFSTKNWVLRVITIVVMVFSIMVQIIFSVSLLDAYGQLLPARANGLVEWLPGLNQPQFLRWILLPQSWNTLGWDIAWSRINMTWLIAGFIIVSILVLSAIIVRKFRIIILTVSSLALVGLSYSAFTQLYAKDTLYWAQTPELFDVLTILEREASPIEPLFLAGSADVTYERFLLNYNTLQTVRPVVIGFQAGERTSPADELEIVSDFNPARINVSMLRFIDQVISFQDRFWWLAHNSEFTPWALRPEERLFAENYYLLNEYQTGNPTVRLLEFSSIQAPNRYDFRLPEHLSTLEFGNSIALKGYTLPEGNMYHASDVIAMTLLWQTETQLDSNYTVSWFVVNQDEPFNIIQGLDSAPNAGFAPTLSWQPNELIVDNRALVLPEDVPAGPYQIWLRLYESESGGNNQLGVIGGDTYNETTAILPITLQIDADR